MKKTNYLLTMVMAILMAGTMSAQDLPVTIEAESGTMGTDFRVVDTLGFTCVTINTDIINSANPGSDNRTISYQVNFADSGTYDLYAHVLIGSGTFDDDSFFYGNGFGIKSSITDGDWIRSNGLAGVGYSGILDVVDGGGTAGSNIWKWINLSKYQGDAPPISFRVNEGELSKTFETGARENGLYIDKFVFGRTGLKFTVDNLNKGEAGTTDQPSNEPTNQPIAAGKSKFLGCEWDYNQSPYFYDYWNQATPGNAGKWASVEGTRDVMNWNVLDSTYNVAKRNHGLFKEHTLIWGAQQPSWIGSLDTASQRQEIEEWFAAMANRYDSIDYIDVVNEPMHNAPNGMLPWGATTPNVNYADALGGAGTTGYDWIITSFRLARKYFPASKLIINEYSVINSTTETNKYIKIINLLKAENLIDGIGEQGHAFTTYGVSAATLKANLDALAATGIPIYITEMDIDGPTDLDQLKEMQRVFPIFWNHPGIEGITFWGFRYGVWRQDQKAYLINQDGSERPAMKWLKAYVNDTITLTDSIHISVQDNINSIGKGEQLQMKASVFPANTTIPNVYWSVSPTSLASINQNGLLTARAKGTVTVKATAWDGSSVKDTYTVKITYYPVQSVTVSAKDGQDSVYVGENLQLSSTVLPENATDPSVSWSVEPEGYATISSSGLLSSDKPGNVKVIATANDGSGKTDTINIKIQNRLVSSIDVSIVGHSDSIQVGNTVMLAAEITPSNATDKSYSWSMDPEGIIRFLNNNMIIAVAGGKVTVTATANDASEVSGSMVINVIGDGPNKIDEQNNNSINIYPNPALNGQFRIEGIQDITQIELLNIAGVKIASYNNLNQSAVGIKVNAKPGMYILKLSDGKKATYRKISFK